MAIQNRRGDYSDFDPQKMVPGEWAVVLSGDPNSERGRAVYMAFDVGEIERMATYEDMQENIVSATTDVQAQFASELTQTIANANAAVSDMRDDVDEEIASATETVNALSIQANTATGNARVATEQANQAAETAYNAADSVRVIIETGSTVASWNNRTGLVVPQAGDYNSSQITHNSTTVADGLTFDDVPLANSARAVKSSGLFSILGNTALGTVASTITGAIKELLDKINNRKIIWRTYTFTGIGIGANLNYSTARDIAVSGYRPFALAGWLVQNDDVNGKNAGWCVVDRLWLGTETIGGTATDAIVYTVWNQNTEEQANVKVLFRVAYVSSDVFSV